MANDTDTALQLTARQRGELEVIRRGWLTETDQEPAEEPDQVSPGRAHALAWMKRRGWDIG